MPEVDAGPSLEQGTTSQTPVADVDVVAHRNASVDEETAPAPSAPAETERPAQPTFTPVRPSRLSKIIPHSTKKEKEKEKEAKSPETPTSPSKREGGGVKRLLTKLKRKSNSKEEAEKDNEKAFAGGAVLNGKASGQQGRFSTSAEGAAGSHDHDDVSSLSSDEEEELAHGGNGERGRPVSRVSAISGDEEFEEARDEFDERLAPPPSFSTEGKKSLRTGSPVREAKFHEEL